MMTLDTHPTRAVPEAVKRAVVGLLHERLSVFGVMDIDIYPSLNHQDEPAITVRIKIPLIEEPIDVKIIHAAESAARDLAWELGERRFLYTEHDYDENQQIARSKRTKKVAHAA
jgi:hypothetical protein